MIINADDYAMDAGVDAAVLELGERGVVTATSAMVLSPRWPEAGRRLSDTPIDRGLHLDLTSPFAEGGATPRSLPRLMMAAFGRQLDRAAIRRTIDRQLELFETVLGTPPHFVDGHQHVHQLPGIREELMDALKTRYDSAMRSVAIRLCEPRRSRGLKAAIIASSGARGLAGLAAAAGHPANSDFAGVYGFSPQADLPRLWRRWLDSLEGDRPLVMCHVATREIDGGPDDSIRSARLNEWKWLASCSFDDLCNELGFKRAPWGRSGQGRCRVSSSAAKYS